MCPYIRLIWWDFGRDESANLLHEFQFRISIRKAHAPATGDRPMTNLES